MPPAPPGTLLLRGVRSHPAPLPWGRDLEHATGLLCIALKGCVLCAWQLVGSCTHPVHAAPLSTLLRQIFKQERGAGWVHQEKGASHQ